MDKTEWPKIPSRPTGAELEAYFKLVARGMVAGSLVPRAMMRDELRDGHAAIVAAVRASIPAPVKA